MSVILDLMIATAASDLPAESDFQRWLDCACRQADLNTAATETEVGIRLIDEDESATLNQQYRNKAGATNVLSFSGSSVPGTPYRLLGDLAICAPLVKREALDQNKSLQAHWAHLTVHGLLHLLGHDHADDAEAAVMEALEVRVLAELGYANPYV